MDSSGRVVQLVLCTEGQMLGALPPFPVEVPWWPEVGDIVDGARDRFGLEIAVLRLIGCPTDRRSGGEVTYLAEVMAPGDVPASVLRGLLPWTGHPGDPLAEHPLRQPWARPGGPAAALAWARERLTEQGVEVIGSAEQRKSWNLSAIWRIPTSAGAVWLKCVPEFFAHEGAVIRAVGASLAPVLLAAEPGRILLADIAGEDHHDATGSILPPMIDLLVAEQAHWIGRDDELFALGLPDRRLPAVAPRIAEVAESYADKLTHSERHDLRRLVDQVPERITELEACGIPNTLVHGDFHSGNVRGRPGSLVILDWGDSAVGHPLTDELAFTRALGAADRAVAAAHFARAWQALLPGCDPSRAAELLQPVSALIGAVQYADFVDAIEPDEHVYHLADVPALLRQAVAATR
ncbi:phosphotransferase family protein [Tessaracoccus caeni]|uniref:phosphotransferase family protein n=1 Tax=Tessaracoccus caeni TaxID=3031239 RepID=UPI0023DA221D|nr:phosphotransferase [Tessaracoccus caeni]MDF1490260.1 phosphotransferase [Tessaracoccus caeni]